MRSRAGTEISVPVLERTLAMCAGNPLLLERAADSLRQGDAGAAILGRPDLRLLLTRFLGVSEDDRRLLQVASVLGTRFRAAVAGEVAGLSDRQTIAALAGLTRAGLVAGGGGG